jgi:carbamoyltransferase
MYVLGLNSVYHESAACLLADGQIVAMAEEERFNRIKHGKKPTKDNPHELPVMAIRYCLETAGIELSGVSHIGYSSDPSSMKSEANPHREWHAEFVDNIEKIPGILADQGFTGDFHFVGHHLAHAASSYYPAPFEEAAVLSIDGIGDTSTTAWYAGSGSQIRLLDAVPAPNSLGFLWELVSLFLGFDIYDATKIMGLAAYGNPDRYAEQFQQLIRLEADGRFQTDNEVLRFWQLDYLTPSGYYRGLESLFGLKKRDPREELSAPYQDISAALQHRSDEVLLHIAEHMHKATGSRNLCIAGGVALNCVTNRHVFEEGPFERMFIQPAAHDAGTAIGCATYIWHHLLGHEERETTIHPYWGPSYSSTETETALADHNLSFTKCDDTPRRVAELIAEAKVVGFFQGRMEAGPRALGHRSLLADPRHPDMRDILNHQVKHREYFRPFAPSVLHEESKNWFQISKETSASDFMLMAYPVQPQYRERIPAVVHDDGTSRVQTVKHETSPVFHAVISAFFELTGVPLVLNTSFNDSEPIVCSPADAIRTFLKTEIDALVLGDYIVIKAENEETVKEWRRRNRRTIGELFDDAVKRHQVYRIDGFSVLTDHADDIHPEQVLPLFAEHKFFLEELNRDRIRNAEVLEIGVGSGVLSIAAVRAGARRVTALEVSSRAKNIAGFNFVVNGCADRVSILDGSPDVFSPVKGKRFDYVISNPPFLPTPPDADFFLHSSAGIYGLDVLEQIVTHIDDSLSDNGCAQFVTVAPGNNREPFLLFDLLKKHLSGTTRVSVNLRTLPFGEFVEWLGQIDMVDEEQAAQLQARATEDGVTALHLCVIHYERGPRSFEAHPSQTIYDEWELPLIAEQP